MAAHAADVTTLCNAQSVRSKIFKKGKKMGPKFIKVVAAAAWVIYATVSFGLGAWAQSVSDVAGTWVLVSSITEKDGVKTDQFGAGAKGTLSLDTNGHFMLTIIGPDLP